MKCKDSIILKLVVLQKDFHRVKFEHEWSRRAYLEIKVSEAPKLSDFFFFQKELQRISGFNPIAVFRLRLKLNGPI